MISIFNVDLTLGPEIAQPNLIISEDRNIMTMKKIKPFFFPTMSRKFTFYPAVLRSEGFEVARSYLQVVRVTGAWS